MNHNIPSVEYTISHDLCTGCGICMPNCPSSVITMTVEKGLYLPKIEIEKCNNSKGCHRCLDVCPGVGVNLIAMAKELFQSGDEKNNKMCGRYLKCFTGYSIDNEIRYHCASGGMVSQFLIWLLEKGKIDGALVTRFDGSNYMMADSFIATTKEEILSARSSKYSPVSFHKAISELKKAPGNRYVVVGLPCHIQGIRKMMSVDKKMRDKIYGVFALYCSSGRSIYLTDKVLQERGVPKSELTYFQYRDEGCLGKMVLKVPIFFAKEIKTVNEYGECIKDKDCIVYKEHFQSYYHPLRSFFIPNRCLYCIDHYGELGDLCFGDIHIKPYSDDKVGVNSIIVKNKKWLDLLIECKDEDAVYLEEVTFEIISDSQRMSFKKKGRNGAFINIGKKIGKAVPQYDVDYLRKPNKRDWYDFLQIGLQQFIGQHKSLWPLITKLKSKVKID